jgi:signal peptidase II
LQHRFLALSIILIALDQLSKHLIATNFNLGESINIISGLLNWTYAHNTGIAFSMLADFEYSRYLLPTISIIASIVLVYFIYQTTNTLKLLAFSLILAGAFGNFIDRAFFGYVIDFIHFYYNDWHFAIFNVADSCITLGVIALLVSKDEKSTNK